MDTLPDDPKLLKQILKGVLEDHQRLQHRFELLLRSHYGKKSEKFVAEQSLLSFAELPAPVPPPEEPAPEPTAPRKNGHGRKPLPAHLRRERTVCDVPEGQRVCPKCGAMMTKIAELPMEQLDYEPAQFYVREVLKCVYACQECHEGVVAAETPSKPIEKGEAGPGLLAQVATSKYGDHCPLERQSVIYKRSGVEIAPSTMCDWMAQLALLAAPLMRAMEADILRGVRLNTDDTPVPVLDPLLDQTREGRLWVYVGDRDHPHVVYRYTPNHKQDDAVEFLSKFSGKLQADAYKGYDAVFKGGRVIEVGCWAHTRRYFFDAKKSDPPRARAALTWIQELYKIEEEVRGEPADRRREVRQARARPVLDKIKPWFEEIREAALPKSPIGEAVKYALGNWRALEQYLEDGELEIDNNLAERSLRGVALGRKNWLFAGSDKGGERAAVLYTLVQTCKRHGVDPWAYLRDMIARLGESPESDIPEFMPHRWKLAHAAASTAPTQSKSVE